MVACVSSSTVRSGQETLICVADALSTVTPIGADEATEKTAGGRKIERIGREVSNLMWLK